MKLLMITRKLDKDDAQAGFAYNWVKKIGQKTEELKVICLEKGNIEGLSQNIEVFSLGKEKGKNRLKEFINFQRGALKFIGQVDGVFCHQNPEYTILIAPYAKLFRKKIVCFYAHKTVNWRVRLMTFLANKVVTSNLAGFRIDTPKRKVIGQGIDTDFFKPANSLGLNPHEGSTLMIISVGRISPIKNYETLIEAADVLKKQDLKFNVRIVGAVVLEKQKDYFNKLKEMVKEKELAGYIEFIGGVPQDELVKLYQGSDLAVNLCPTGAPDKAGFEAMASGLPFLASNQSYVKNFGPYVEQLLFKEKSPKDLANKIMTLAQSNQLEEIGSFLRERVVKEHNLDNLLQKIIACF